MGTFGTRASEKKPIVCPELKTLGFMLYVDERKNGEVCLQIRQDKPHRLRLKSFVMGRAGQGDIVYEHDRDTPAP